MPPPLVGGLRAVRSAVLTMLTDSGRVLRPSWAEVPATVRVVVEEKLGSAVSKAWGQVGGFTPGLASRLALADGRRVFVKGLPATHAQAASYRLEGHVVVRLPANAPTPRLLFGVDEEWIVLAFEDVDGREPNVRPGSPDLAAVLSALNGLAKAFTPCPVRDAPSVLVDLAPLLRGWAALAVAPPTDLDPWALRNLDSLVAVETAWHPWAEGDTLLHNDLRPDNLIRRVADGRVVVVDWSYPCHGAPWLDVVSLVPHLLMAGHTPADAERLVLSRSAVARVPAWAVTGFAAAWAGYWELNSRLPEPAGSLGLRAYQRRAASAARQWVAHRTRWP
ncbi:phosphotransferase family protein [Streptoalloteichus hindustanus]|uniref:Thiamine kinase n=1 Tax=Streptoalloteichus hindustanus TaxID=2017 RepID=A0A1M5B1F5_STRHI|nr:phosphotransferase [Streptoalloteichus hindustanus]SHF36157.1 Thiamine kinase [Streptoalloteichus hindustanus]